MKKNIIIYGLIAGIVASVLMLFSIIYGLIAGIVASVLMLFSISTKMDYNVSLFVGYASMLIAFSFVFVGIRNYRDKYNDGLISFGKAFNIGIMIVLIASTIYVIAWLIDYFYFVPDYLEKYSAHIAHGLKAGGASQMEIDKRTKEMADIALKYKNPFFNAIITYTEILPVGFVVTLIVH